MTEQPKPNEVQPEKTLIDRITGVVDEVMKAKLCDFEKKIDAKIEDILKAKEVEIEQALRKTFGTETDPVIHRSDLIASLRKAELERADTQKKTPAPVEKAGPEGNKPANPIDLKLQEYGFTEVKA